MTTRAQASLAWRRGMEGQLLGELMREFPNFRQAVAGIAEQRREAFPGEPVVGGRCAQAR